MKLKILNLLTLVFVVVINALANILPINGVMTGEVSAAYDNYFTPAGFTFAIWSVIYLGLLSFVAFQFLSKTFRPDTIGWLFIINGLSNIGWIYSWHHQLFSITVILMLVILATLLVINLRIDDSSMWVKVPFQLYLGWINVATIANLAVFLTYLEWSALGIKEEIWGIVLVSVAAFLGLWQSWIKGWYFGSLAIAWGIWGIYQKQTNLDQSEVYQFTCVLAILAILSGVLIKFFSKKVRLISS